MDSETSKNTMQCVNCGLKIKRSKRIWLAEESVELRQLLSDWACKELEDNDAVCTECYHLLHLGLQSENKIRKFGHKSVCLSCGVSIVGSRSQSVVDHPEYNLVVKWVPSHQVKRLERICIKCWTKAHRLDKQKNEVHSHGVEIKIETLGDGELDIPASGSETESETEVFQLKPQPASISMATYRRAAESSTRCIFDKCQQSGRSAPPKILKERLLVDYSYYIPKHARICDGHRHSPHKSWRDLYNNCKITDFNVTHLENMCSVLKNTNNFTYCKKFDSFIKNDEYLCKYLLGVDYKTYEDMLKDVEPLKKHFKFLRKGLVIYLMKKHTDFSYEKMSWFFKVTPKTVMKSVNIVHKFLESKVASDDSYVAISTVNCENEEEIVYLKRYNSATASLV